MGVNCNFFLFLLIILVVGEREAGDDPGLWVGGLADGSGGMPGRSCCARGCSADAASAEAAAASGFSGMDFGAGVEGCGGCLWQSAASRGRPFPRGRCGLSRVGRVSLVRGCHWCGVSLVRGVAGENGVTGVGVSLVGRVTSENGVTREGVCCQRKRLLTGARRACAPPPRRHRVNPRKVCRSGRTGSDAAGGSERLCQPISVAPWGRAAAGGVGDISCRPRLGEMSRVCPCARHRWSCSAPGVCGSRPNGTPEPQNGLGRNEPGVNVPSSW